MISAAFGKGSLIAAGIATAVMGAFHFFLPPLFGWARFVDRLPAEIRWALFSLNTFLSVLLLTGGLASLAAARRWGPAAAWPARIMAIFWAFNAAYQLVRPFPTPGVRWVLLGFALLVAALYALALFSMPASPTAAPAPKPLSQ